MKKNHPTPSPSPSIEELTQRYEDAAPWAATAKKNYTKAAQKSAKLPPIPEEEEKELSLAERSHHHERKRGPLSKEEVLGIIQENRAVQRYGAQIQHWCGIVFGNSDILQKKMQEILEDPTVGEQVLSSLTEDPKSFHKLAGRNLLGFQTDIRRRARNGLSHLSDAVENYADAVKQVKESIMRTNQERQNYQEQSVGLDKQLQKQQKIDVHSREVKKVEKASLSKRISD
ncbi:BID domain-containing T4SS effector [Bartonella gliris]|uniref:BID domain-containing T4SS effector n=1 Tax=Bartonella gliris TaxID=3004109 RepID=UPI00295F53CC|nr:BID domain-containing T4SS effector [Bartonella gliris]